MSRLIDADKLKKDVLNLPDCYNGFSDTYDKAWIIGVIDEQPTIEERKKGKWILPNNPIARANDEWICSGCHYLIGGKHNYCPNCGSYNGGENET